MSQDAPTPLTVEAIVERARALAHTLYDGSATPHRSCGVAIAETFGRPTISYQSLRKGGITGCGECGAIKGGELVLGELLGDPDPTGSVTPALRAAAARYRELWQQALDHPSSIICNDLTGVFDEFRSPERHAMCTGLATTVAACVAQTLLEVDVSAPLHGDWQAAILEHEHSGDVS